MSVRIQGKVRAANADANQLELAIINLAVNARDAMPAGGAITITVREEHVEVGEDDIPAGDYICVVADRHWRRDGRGNAGARNRAVLHDQGRRTRDRSWPVDGARARRAAVGTPRLKSRKGEGTTAELWLPAATGPALKTPAPSREKTRAEEAGAAARPLVVLAVDDDTLVLMNTTAMLEDLGHSCA